MLMLVERASDCEQTWLNMVTDIYWPIVSRRSNQFIRRRGRRTPRQDPMDVQKVSLPYLTVLILTLPHSQTDTSPATPLSPTPPSLPRSSSTKGIKILHSRPHLSRQHATPPVSSLHAPFLSHHLSTSVTPHLTPPHPPKQ